MSARVTVYVHMSGGDLRPFASATLESDLARLLVINLVDEFPDGESRQWEYALMAMAASIEANEMDAAIERSMGLATPPRPTATQEMCDRIPPVRYDSTDGFGGPRETCAVCLSNLRANSRVKRLPCGHTFHAKCIDACFKRTSIQCPCCRVRVDL